MPPKSLFRLGLSFLFIGAITYFATGHWLDSRIFTPLDDLVSLDGRQLKSPPFQINLNETYFASLDLDYSADDWYQDNRCNYKTILYPQWRMYRLGATGGQPRELWVSSEQLNHDGMRSNAFLASPSRYQLEWDISAPAPCLNARHPRLFVFADSLGYQQAAGVTQLFCVFLGGVGLSLILLAAGRTAQHVFHPAGTPRMLPDMVLHHFVPIAKHAPLPPIHGLPHWGLFGGSVLWILIFIFMIFGPQTPHGLLVSLRNREVAAGEKSPWTETLAVDVRPPHRFFVNGEEVEKDSLRTTLLEHLSRNGAWSVYFEADSDVPYMDAIYAIDTIQGCGAKLIWITPKMREEWQREEPPAHPVP
ncbi:MAG: biopolymer transporter ExbD [Candidatus Acidiferrum sp.]